MWSPLPVQSVWRVLTNYEGLTNVFSNIKSSSIASREPDLVVYQVRSAFCQQMTYSLVGMG